MSAASLPDMLNNRLICAGLVMFLLAAVPATAQTCELTVTVTATPAFASCNGDTATLQATASGGDGNYSYQWNGREGPLEGATSSTLVVNGGRYSVTVTDGSGCVVTSDSYYISYDTLSADITAWQFCLGETGYAEVPPASDGATYEWSVTNGTIFGQSDNWVYITPTASPVTIGVTVSTPGGCTESGSITRDVGEPVSVSIATSGPTTFCAPGSVTLTANATNATSFYWSTNETTQSITVTDSGSYWVSASNESGCGAYASVQVQAASAAASMTSSGGGTMCAGGSRTISAVLSGTAPWDITWNDGVTQTSSTSTVYRTVSPTVTTTYSIATVTDASGCTGTTSGSTTITVVPPPTAALTGGDQICPNMSAPLSVALTGNAPWTVTWSDGHVQQVYQTPFVRSVSPQTTTTYTITSVSDNYCNVGTSSGSATVVVAPPTATVSGGGSFCPGGSATVSAALTGEGPWHVTWSDGPAITYTSPNVTRTVTAPGTYTVYAISDSNCNGTASGSAVVTQLATPTAVVSGGGAICPGGSANITATLTGSAPWSVTWSDGVTATYESSAATRTVSAAGAYSITAVSDANCSGTASGSASVTMLEPPTATVSGGGYICPGGFRIVEIDFTGTGPWTVTWTNGATHTYENPQTELYIDYPSTWEIASVSDANCGGTSSGSAIVTATPAPTAVVSGGGTICPGGVATLDVAFTGTGPWTVRWSDGVTRTYTTANATRTVSAAGTYTIESFYDTYCGTTDASGSATVTVATRPTATVSGSATICAGSPATITATLTGTAPWTVTWSDGVTATYSTSTASRTVTAAGTYSIASVSDAYCSGTSSGSATITVRSAPVITTQPRSQTIRKNTSATLTVAATSDTAISYQWYRGAAGNTSTPVGTNSSSYTTPKLTTQTSYWVRVTNSCGATNSSTAVISTQ